MDNHCISLHTFLQTYAGGTEASIFAEVVFEPALRDMKQLFKRGGVGVLGRRKSVSGEEASMLDQSVDLEYRYKEGVCVGGGEIRLQGECKIDHGSLLKILNGRLGMFLYPEDVGILRF